MAEERNQNEQQGNQDNRSSRSSSSRGFASMDPQKQREIASAGGRAAHRQGVAHEWSTEEAREAGRKGGQHSHGGGRSSQRNQSEGDDSDRNR